MEIEFYKTEFIGLTAGIEACLNLSGAKFNYSLVKIEGKIKKESEPLKAAEEPCKTLKEFFTKRSELAKQYAATDEKGIITENVIGAGPFPVLKDKQAFIAEFTPILAKYKKVIDAYPKQQQDYQDLLLTKAKLELTRINPSHFPADLTFGQMLGIIAVIEPPSESSDTIPVTFNRAALMNFGQVFTSLNAIAKPEFVAAMVGNMITIYRFSLESYMNKKVLDYQYGYERARLDLCRAHTEYDHFYNIKFVMENGSPTFVMKNPKAFAKELEALKKKWAKVIDEYEVFMQEKIDLKLRPVQLSDFPDDATGEQMRTISDFLV